MKRGTSCVYFCPKGKKVTALCLIDRVAQWDISVYEIQNQYADQTNRPKLCISALLPLLMRMGRQTCRSGSSFPE